MEKQDMRKIENQLCDVLHDIAGSGLKSASDVETVKHALSAMVKLKCLEEMDGYEGGNSGRSYRSYEGVDNGSYRGGRYMDGGSYRHYDGGYSGHGDIRQKLEEIARDAEGRDREMIQQMLSRM